MQKSLFSFTKVILLFIFFNVLLTSCKKEPTRKPFKVTETTWYRVSPKAPEDVVVNGTTYIGNAFFPGGGTGNATHMGNITTYYNQQVYSTTLDGLPLGSVAAPVTNVPSYPVFGGPLPLIQSSDFTAFAALNTTMQIPVSINGHIINSVIYNDKGDAVFTSAITGSGATFPISQTIVGFNGKALIVGGKGKFANASGEIDYNGYFNVVNPNDATYNADGWIEY